MNDFIFSLFTGFLLSIKLLLFPTTPTPEKCAKRNESERARVVTRKKKLRKKILLNAENFCNVICLLKKFLHGMNEDREKWRERKRANFF